MTEKQLFSVVVRGFGLYAFFVGLTNVCGVIRDYEIRVFGGYPPIVWQVAVGVAVFYFFLAFVLLAQADAIVELLYRPQGPKDADDSN